MTSAGRKELLTEQVAKQICQMIEKMPDNGIHVTWQNVITHSEKRLGHRFNRQMLSQKEWAGRKLIAEAFSEAKEVQKRMTNDSTLKYKTSPKSVLQRRVSELEARIFALKEELEIERSRKIDILDAFLNSRCDLEKLLRDDLFGVSLPKSQ